MRLKATGALAMGALLLGGIGTAAAQDVTVSAIGYGQVGVSPKDRKSEASIRQAVAAAQPQAVRLAVRDARAQARLIAEETGLLLGPLTAVEPYQSPYGGPFFNYSRFGPNNYCGMVSTPIRRLNPETGRRVVVRRVKQRKCFPPPFVSSSVEVTFSATPAPPAAPAA
jgi:hypothetical protein